MDSGLLRTTIKDKWTSIENEKYVEDLNTAVPENERIKQVFNSFDSHIQFTVESETDRKIPYRETEWIGHTDGSLKMVFKTLHHRKNG